MAERVSLSSAPDPDDPCSSCCDWDSEQEGYGGRSPEGCRGARCRVPAWVLLSASATLVACLGLVGVPALWRRQSSSRAVLLLDEVAKEPELRRMVWHDAFNKCLDVPSGSKAKGTPVQLWDCLENQTHQEFWHDGSFIRWLGHEDRCLTVGANTHAGDAEAEAEGQGDVKVDGVAALAKHSFTAPVVLWSCDTRNRGQQWEVPSGSGPVQWGPIRLKSDLSLCLTDQNTPPENGSPAQIVRCSEEANSLQAPMQTSPLPDTGNFFCWTVIMSSGYEPGLLRYHWEQKINAFSCEGYTIFSDEATPALDFVPVVAIGSLLCPKGPWGSWANAGVFLKAWDRVVAMGVYARFKWTLKVDADTVFLPERVLKHLRGLVPEDPVYVRPPGIVSGPMEIFSVAAVKVFADRGGEVCTNGIDEHGEDGYISGCMDLLGVQVKEDPFVTQWGQPEVCMDARFMAFHPMKNVELYKKCYDVMLR